MTQTEYLAEKGVAYEGMKAYGFGYEVVSKIVKISEDSSNDEFGMSGLVKEIAPGTVVGVAFDTGNTGLALGLNPMNYCEPLYRKSITETAVFILGVTTLTHVDVTVDGNTHNQPVAENDTLGVLEVGYIWMRPETNLYAYTTPWVRTRRNGESTKLGSLLDYDDGGRAVKAYNITPIGNSVAGELNLIRIEKFNYSQLFRDETHVIPEPREVDR